MKTDEHSFQDRRLKLSLQYYYTKPWRIYVSSQTKPNQNILICGAFTFLKSALVFGKDLYYHSNEGSLMRGLRLWEEQQRTVLTIHPKGMTRLVEASASVRWLLWTSWLVPCHTACNDSLLSCQGGQKSNTAKNHLGRAYPNGEYILP